MKYRLLSGEDLDVPAPSKELAAFIARLQSALHDPNIGEQEMVALMYGRENPLLDQSIFKDRGAVTKAIFGDPTYHMMLDMLSQKRIQAGTLVPAMVAERYTMRVADAARALGVTPSAVRQAIAAHKLSSDKRDGEHFLDPKEVKRYELSNRGPRAAEAEGPRVGAPLEVRLGSFIKPGNDAGVRFNVKRKEGDVLVNENANVWEGTLTNWRRIGVYAGSKDRGRFWIIEPSDDEDEIAFEGFYVRGKFRKVQVENNAQRAREAFKVFEAT